MAANLYGCVRPRKLQRYVRHASWEAAVSGISDNFITGLGFRQSTAQLHNFFGPEWAGYSVVYGYVENTYLSLFLDEGVFGFCLWMIVLGSLVTAGIKAYRLNLRHRFWVLAALASIAGFAINAFTFDSLFIWPNVVLFWIAAGIIRGVSELDNNLDNDIMTPN